MNKIKKKILKNYSSTKSMELMDEMASKITPDNEEISNWNRNYLLNHKTRISIDLDLVKSNAQKNDKILEFGAIPLLLTLAIKESGYSVTGVDISPERYASKIQELNLNVQKCDIEKEKLNFKDNSFEFVLFNEIFEHLRINPIFTMKEVFRVMKPNGTMMLSTPNLRSVNGLYFFIFKNQSFTVCQGIYNEYLKLEKIGHMGHVREYTTTEMVNFLTKIGFEIETIYYRGQFKGKREMVRKIAPKLSPFVTYICKKPLL